MAERHVGELVHTSPAPEIELAVLGAVRHAQRVLHINKTINVNFFIRGVDKEAMFSWHGRVFLDDDVDGFVLPGDPTTVWVNADLASVRRAFEVGLHEVRHCRQSLDGGLRDRHADELQAQSFARTHLERIRR